MSRWGERRSKGLSPGGFRARPWALSSQPRGSPHPCSPQEAHEQTGGLSKCTCCVLGDLSLGHRGYLSGSTSQVLLCHGERFPHADGQDRTCTS